MLNQLSQSGGSILVIMLMVVAVLVGGTMFIVDLIQNAFNKRTARKLQALLHEGGIDSDVQPRSESGMIGGGIMYHFTYRQHDVCVGLLGSRKESGALLFLGATRQSDETLRIEPEDSAQQFAERLGLGEKIRSGDPVFDRQFNIISDDEEFAASWIGDARRRQQIAAFFAQGGRDFEFRPHQLVMAWPGGLKFEDLDVGSLKMNLNTLLSFLEGPPVAVVSHTSDHWLTQGRFYFGLVLSMILGFLSIVVLGTQTGRVLDRGALFLDSLKYSLGALALVFGGVILLTRHKTWFAKGLRNVALLWIALFLFVGPIMEESYNNRSDVASKEHVEPVLSRHMVHGKNSTSYYVVISSWRPGHPTESVGVTFDVYNSVQPGHSRLDIVTRPGQLGFEWVASYRVLN